jgi:Co/Zn/Cd efflux system component
MQKSKFHISGMDCPSEEQLIQGVLSEVEGIEQLQFDLPARELCVWHSCDVSLVSGPLDTLKLGSTLRESKEGEEAPIAEPRDQRGVLRFLLIVNALMFVGELVAGWYGESTGLISDALDMFADATVYGIALWAVGGGGRSQKVAARLSGWVQMALGVGVLVEVTRRALVGSAPEAPVMLSMASVALVANLVCVMALSRHRGDGLHMRASWIFSTNDVIANIGVMIAGGLVYWTGSAWPDLVIGTIIAFVVMGGARRILQLGRQG